MDSPLLLSCWTFLHIHRRGTLFWRRHSSCMEIVRHHIQRSKPVFIDGRRRCNLAEIWTGAILHGHFTREPVKIAKLPGFSSKRENMQILHYTRSNAVKRRSNHSWLYRTGFSQPTSCPENFPGLLKNKIFPTAGICLKRSGTLNANGSNHDILFSHQMEKSRILSWSIRKNRPLMLWYWQKMSLNG